jgi:hypothetical protein
MVETKTAPRGEQDPDPRVQTLLRKQEVGHVYGASRIPTYGASPLATVASLTWRVESLDAVVDDAQHDRERAAPLGVLPVDQTHRDACMRADALRRWRELDVALGEQRVQDDPLPARRISASAPDTAGAAEK